MIILRVDGKPIPQGSLQVFNGRIVHVKSKELLSWRKSIAFMASGNTITDLPVRIKLDFELVRGVTVKRKKPTVPPDLDKLVRAVLDALTGVLYFDDAQVVEIEASKKYSETPGVSIQIQTFTS